VSERAWAPNGAVEGVAPLSKPIFFSARAPAAPENASTLFVRHTSYAGALLLMPHSAKLPLRLTSVQVNVFGVMSVPRAFAFSLLRFIDKDPSETGSGARSRSRAGNHFAHNHFAHSAGE
jgi:hypothetical protein